MNYSNEEKEKIVNRYLKGDSATKLAKDNNISKSTLYNWITRFKRTSVQEIRISRNKLRKDSIKLERLERENSIYLIIINKLKLSRNQKLSFAAHLDTEYPIHTICRVLDLARATYYHDKYRQPEVTLIESLDNSHKPIIQRIFTECQGRLGARKIKYLMKNEGHIISERKVKKLMKEMNLILNKPDDDYNNYHKRNYSYKPNIIRKSKYYPEPNKIWISDITYIKNNNFHYY